MYATTTCAFASFLIDSGRSIYEVQRQLGHNHVRTTQRYDHLPRNPGECRQWLGSMLSASLVGLRSLPVPPADLAQEWLG